MTTSELAVGLDVGGTKVSVMDSDTVNIARYETAAFTDLARVLQDQVGVSACR